MDKKIENLIEYCDGVLMGKNKSELYEKYLDEIKSITPQELVYIQNEQLKNGHTVDDILEIVDKLIMVFHESLSKHKLTEPIDTPFLHYLNEENKGLIAKLEDFKQVIKTEPLANNSKTKVFLEQIKKYNEHLLKLENVFFPYLEKREQRFDGLKILWALHDVIRALIKDVTAEFEKSDDEQSLKRKIAQLYFKLYGLVQKQELVLFPSAVKFLSSYEFDEMHMQSFDYDFPYITPPKKQNFNEKKLTADFMGNIFSTDTGQMNFEQLSLVLDALPFDITYVDEKDEVAYFSKPKDRIFPRSKAAIGRNVRNCHPPKSVHIVEKILQSFKNGQKDIAEFWITIKGTMLLIKYICLRDDAGQYKGTLEIVQEINDIKSLEGEKRLLDWD